ncbi:MAG: OmpA family protein [Myxococcales bacterium]|nr:OmpA family protein [Myxococcales bacterium]
MSILAPPVRTSLPSLRPAHRRLFSASLVALALVAQERLASAQITGWALDRFEPAPAGDSFFTTSHPRAPRDSSGTVHVGLLTEYALRPLVFQRPAGAAEPGFGIVDHQVVLHAQAAGEVVRRVFLDFDLPFVAPIAGSSLSISRVVQGGVPEGLAVGDPRFGLRLRLAGEADRDPLSVYFGAQGFFGFLQSSKRRQFVTDEAFRGRLYLALAGRGGPVRWSFTAGYHARPRLDIGAAFDPTITDGPIVASELFANAGVAWTFFMERASVGLEGWIQTPAERMFARANVAAEVMATGRFKPAPWVELALGLGPGLTRAVGTPAFRAVFSATFLAYDGAQVPRRSAVEDDLAAMRDARGEGAQRNARTTEGDPTSSATGTARVARTEADPCPLGERCDERMLDRDGDGVLAPIDRCPNVPVGPMPDPSRAGCPDPDGDGDGVVDHRDACATEPAGPRPDPLRAGCPLVDRDNDNVADAVDHCPDQPGAPSPDPNRNGCPSLVRLETGALRILEPVYFDTNRATIQPRSFPVLQAVADAMRARTDVRRLSVEGHTDDRGDIERNVDLSNRRAIAVMLWLASHGVEPERLEAHGYGPTRPVGPNRTAPERERNRRVEFRVADPASPSSAAQPSATEARR